MRSAAKFREVHSIAPSPPRPWRARARCSGCWSFALPWVRSPRSRGPAQRGLRTPRAGSTDSCGAQAPQCVRRAMPLRTLWALPGARRPPAPRHAAGAVLGVSPSRRPPAASRRQRDCEGQGPARGGGQVRVPGRGVAPDGHPDQQPVLQQRHLPARAHLQQRRRARLASPPPAARRGAGGRGPTPRRCHEQCTGHGQDPLPQPHGPNSAGRGRHREAGDQGAAPPPALRALAHRAQVASPPADAAPRRRAPDFAGQGQEGAHGPGPRHRHDARGPCQEPGHHCQVRHLWRGPRAGGARRPVPRPGLCSPLRAQPTPA